MLSRPHVLHQNRMRPVRCTGLRHACRGLVALAALVLLPSVAGAQGVRPWLPPGQDSIQAMASEARMMFRRSDADTISERNIVPDADFKSFNEKNPKKPQKPQKPTEYKSSRTC